MGVGGWLKTIVQAEYDVPPCSRCHETAAKMDRLGVDGCREQLAELGRELQANAHAMSWEQLIAAASRPTMRKAVGAVKAASQGEEFFRGLVVRAIEACEAAQDAVA